MWTQRTFKAARIFATVALAGVSTAFLLQGSHLNWLNFKGNLLGSQPKEISAPLTSANREAEPGSKPTSIERADKTGRTETSPAESSVAIGPDQSTSDSPQSTDSHTTGSATTTGSAATTGSATTGSARSGRRVIPVRAYAKEAPDVRLRLLMKDLTDDLRQSALDVTDAKMRGQNRTALQVASEALLRSQERTEILGDVLQDRRSFEVNKAPANESHPTSGKVGVSGAAADVQTTGVVTKPKDSSPWFEPATLVGILGFLVTVIMAWSGDNLSERWFGRKSGSPNERDDVALKSAKALERPHEVGSPAVLLAPASPTATGAANNPA